MHRHKCLPQGIKIATNTFYRILGGLFSDMPNVKVHIDDMIIMSNGTFEEYLTDAEELLKRLSEAGLQVNAEKWKWAAHKLAFLGFNLTRDGFKPDPAKVKALLKMAPQQNIKQLKRFLGGINFYRRM